MSSRPRPLTRWALPAGLAAATVTASLVAPTLARAEPDLPDVTAAELLADLRTDPVEGFSGTVVHRADLGLPSLPGLTDGGSGGPMGESAELTGLLDGEHTLRVWAAAPDRARVSLHGGMSELTVVTDGEELWAWSSEGATATRYLLPEHTADEAAATRAEAGVPPMTPEEVADLVLARLDPTTGVAVGDPVTVAGRSAYELVLDPRAAGTLVDEVRIAVDAADRVPTRVQVFAVGHDTPALEVGFTELSLVAPDDDVFAFTPPPSAVVEDVDLTDVHDGAAAPGATPPAGADPSAPFAGDAPDVSVVGDGWASVLVAALPPGALDRLTGAAPADGDVEAPSGPPGGPPHEETGSVSAGALLEALPEVSGDWGSGRVLESRLFSVLLTEDGRVLVGAVDAGTLQAAAGSAG